VNIRTHTHLNCTFSGSLIEDLIPSDSAIADHPALPIPHEDGLPVAGSSIAICHAGPFANGPPSRVHGGLIAGIFDVIGAVTARFAGRRIVTANLNVNYRQSIPTGTDFVTLVSARLTGERKVKVDMLMCDVDMTTLYADSSSLFVTPKSLTTVTR